MTKNAFYFNLKSIFVLKIFNFLSGLFGRKENGLIRKIRFISKLITSQAVKPNNCNAHIAQYDIQPVSSHKRHKLKFGKLIECKMINIFRDKSYTVIHYSQTLFQKIKNWAYLWINSLKFYIYCFHCIPKSGPLKYIKTKNS